MIVLCDVAGVLAQFDDRVSYEILKGYGVAPERVGMFYQSPEFLDFCRGQLNAEQFSSITCEKYLHMSLTSTQLQFAHDQHFTRAVTEVIDIIKRIPYEQRAILTDSNVWQEERIEELVHLHELSPRVFQSHHMGSVKDDPETFPRVIKELGVAPTEILYIDDLDKKIEHARSLGISAIHFKSAEQLSESLSMFLKK